MIFGIRGALSTMPPQIPCESEVALCCVSCGFRKRFKNDKVCTKVVKNLVITSGSFLDHFRNLRGAHHTATSDSGLFFDNFCTNFVVFRSFSESARRSPQCHIRFARNLRWHYGERPADSENEARIPKMI